MASVVPHFGSPCWYTLDPASLLITSHFNDDMPVFPSEWLANEYYGDDVHQLVDLAHSSAGVSTLYEATNGKPWTSERWQENVKFGGDQELLARLQTKNGEIWGAIGLYREPDRPLFDADDKSFVREASNSLAAGARRALLMAEAREPDSPDAPGLVVLSENWEVESTTPGVDRWLRDLPDGDWPNRRLPSAVLAVAGRVRRNGAHPEMADEIAVSRVRTSNGAWIVLYGAALMSNHSTRVAVILEPAHPFADHTAAHVGVRPDGARAGSDPTRPAGQLHRGDRSRDSDLARTRSSNISRTCSPRPGCAAVETSSARCSSRTTSHACVTTKQRRCRRGRCVVVRFRSRPAGELVRRPAHAWLDRGVTETAEITPVRIAELG